VFFALFAAAAVATVLLLLFDQTGKGLFPAVLLTGVVGLALLLTRSPFASAAAASSRRIPKSQVAEIEKLYFRATREMVTDMPNLPQIINDLQRIVSIDPRYKNARYFLNRALLLQARADGGLYSAARPHRLDFMALQEKLIDMDAGVRKSVVMELIQYSDEAVDPLIALLMDPDPDVRVHAATALGWVGGKDAVQPLLVALQDEIAQVRRYAARALCWVVDESAVDALSAALRDEDTYVRCYAARALGWSHDPRAVRPLVELYQQDTNSDVRQYALIALDDLGQPRPAAPQTIEAD
jgi:hypothetical protein